MNKKIIVALCFALSFLLVIPIFTVYAASQTADFESTGYSHLDAIDTAEGFAFETYEPDNTIKVSGALFYSQFGYNNSSCVSPYSFNDGRPTPYQFRIKRQDGSNFSLSSIFLFADGYGCQYSNMRGYRDGSMVYEQTNIDMDSGVAVSGLNWINIDEIRIFQVDADPEGLAMAVDNIVFDLSVDTTAPTQQALSTITLNEGAASTISSAYLSFTDDTDSDSDVKYTVTDLPDNGSVKNNGSTLSLNGTFTQADINNNLVTYVHDDSNTTSDSFGFKVADSSGNEASGKTFSFTVNAIDDDTPTVVTNAGLTVNEGGTGTIGTSRLEANDADSLNTALEYTVTTLTSNGALKKSGSAVGLNGTFTQADINNNLITYSHNGSNTTSDSFKFTVGDGAGNSIANQTFSINVNAVDDTAPTVATNSGLTLAEGATGTIGISKLEANDEDTDNTSLIYTITSTTDNGRVESTDSAGTPVTSFTQQNLTDNKIRYVHDGSDTTSDSFTFSVSDGSGNSLTGQTFSMTITAVDDTAPVISTNSGLLVMKSDSASLASKLVSTDTETDNSTIAYTVTTAPTSGTLSLSSFTQAQLDAGSVTYTHGGDTASSDSFIFTAADTNGNEVTGQTFNITITDLPTPTPSPTPSPTPAPTAATPTSTRSRTTYSPSVTPAPSATPAPSQEAGAAATPTQTVTPTPIVTPTLVPQGSDSGRTIRMITGVILDSGGNPMAGYIVELHSDTKTAVTDKDGRYTFYDVEYTSHTLIVKSPEEAEVASFEIEFEQGEYFEAEQTPQGAQIVYSETVTCVDIELALSEEGDSVSIVKVENEQETLPAEPTQNTNYWWLWIIVILLIVLVIILIMRLMSNNSKKSPSSR